MILHNYGFSATTDNLEAYLDAYFSGHEDMHDVTICNIQSMISIDESTYEIVHKDVQTSEEGPIEYSRFPNVTPIDHGGFFVTVHNVPKEQGISYLNLEPP